MLLRRAFWGRPARQLCSAQASRCGRPAGVCLARCGGWHAAATVYRSASSAQDGTATGAAIQDRGRARQMDLAEALADLDELVGSNTSSLGNDSELVRRGASKNTIDEHSGGEELTDLLAMVKQRDYPEEASTSTDGEWETGGAADLSDSSRDALSTSVRSRTRAELADALRQEEIEDARARYKKKRWARNWVVKRTAELHRRKADAAEVEQAIQQMITRGDLPTVVTYNTLIAACGRGGSGKPPVRPSDAKRAYNAFVEMKRRGLVPTASTYSALLTTLSRAAVSGRSTSTRMHSAAATRIEAAASGTHCFTALSVSILSFVATATTCAQTHSMCFVAAAEHMYEKVWLEMAQYLSDHARGLVDMSESDRTVLCNSALNAALRRGVGPGQSGRDKDKFAQMREYMRAHGVVHDAVSYTLLVRVAKLELDEAVRETEVVANRTRQQQHHRHTRAEIAAATAAAVAAERQAALALRNLLNLWMVLGKADARAHAAGMPSVLDSRLTNGLLAALASAGRLIDVDPLALTATSVNDPLHADIGHAADRGGLQDHQRGTYSTNNEPQAETAAHESSLDFELGYDVDDSNVDPLRWAEEHRHDDDTSDTSDTFEGQAQHDDESANADESGQWVPRSGFGEERRVRQRKAIVAMSWQLWGSLQTQMETRAATRAAHGNQHDPKRQTGRHRSQDYKKQAQEEQEEREGVAHVLSTLTQVMLRTGDSDDQA